MRSLAKLVTISDLAAEKDVPKRTLHDYLMRLAAQDRRDMGSATWLLRGGHGNTWRINKSLLMQVHPELFDAPTPWDTAERVRVLEHALRDTNKKLNALASSFRAYRADQAEKERSRRQG